MPRAARARPAASPSRPAPTIATSRTCPISGQTTKDSARKDWARAVWQEGGQRLMSQAVTGGWCDPRFGLVRAEFDSNFRERGETGAAVCVTIDGAVVADLWGGWTDARQRQPWAQDTLVNVFSVGKGLLAVCTARLAGLGL